MLPLVTQNSKNFHPENDSNKSAPFLNTGPEMAGTDNPGEMTAKNGNPFFEHESVRFGGGSLPLEKTLSVFLHPLYRAPPEPDHENNHRPGHRLPSP
jgi:hypothetical protein